MSELERGNWSGDKASHWWSKEPPNFKS